MTHVATDRFGTLPDGSPAYRYSLTNANGLIARLTNWGATLTELHVPDRSGRLGDVVLGFDNLDQYLGEHPYFGATIGRVANRIAAGRFTLDGRVHQLSRNAGPHHLHGGMRGFDRVLWRAERLPTPAVGVRFSHVSPDGDEGYPGRLEVAVTMALTDADELVMDFTATTDQATPVNLTNHAYFNLAGQGDVLGHQLEIRADYFTPTDLELIPTGTLDPVEGTPLDFRHPTAIGARLGQLSGDPPGYDHNFVITRPGKGPALAALVFEPATGRTMEVTTTEPAVQLYTANAFDGTITGKRGIGYRRYAGLALETQHFPDALNQPDFPSIVLRPGETYRQTTVFRFSTR